MAERKSRPQLGLKHFAPWLNEIFLMGEISSEIRFRLLERRDGSGPLPSAYFQLHCFRHWMKSPEHLRVWCRLLGAHAASFVKHKKEGDWIFVQGRLMQRAFDAGGETKRWMHQVHVDRFQFLYKSPSKFVGGMATVPVDELRRLRALDRDPHYVPIDLVEELEDDLPRME